MICAEVGRTGFSAKLYYIVSVLSLVVSDTGGASFELLFVTLRRLGLLFCYGCSVQYAEVLRLPFPLCFIDQEGKELARIAAELIATELLLFREICCCYIFEDEW